MDPLLRTSYAKNCHLPRRAMVPEYSNRSAGRPEREERNPIVALSSAERVVSTCNARSQSISPNPWFAFCRGNFPARNTGVVENWRSMANGCSHLARCSVAFRLMPTFPPLVLPFLLGSTNYSNPARMRSTPGYIHLPTCIIPARAHSLSPYGGWPDYAISLVGNLNSMGMDVDGG